MPPQDPYNDAVAALARRYGGRPIAPAPTPAQPDDDDPIAALARKYGGTRIAQPPAEEPTEPSPLWRRAADYGVSALEGLHGVPEAALGLADLATMGAAGGLVEDYTPWHPKEVDDYLTSLYTPEQQKAFRDVQNAEGFLGKLDALRQNPSVAVHSIVQSVPAMFAGGAIGEGATAVLPSLAKYAGAIGEGAIQAGSAAESVRQDNPDRALSGKQAAATLASGIGTGVLGHYSGKIAKALGIDVEDIDQIMAGQGGEAAKQGLVKRILGGAFQEGLLEELPQSVQEQVWQNYAQGKPLDEGVMQAAVLGTVTGGVMGAGGQFIHRNNEDDVTMPPPAPPDAATPPAATPPAAGPTPYVPTPETDPELQDLPQFLKDLTAKETDDREMSDFLQKLYEKEEGERQAKEEQRLREKVAAGQAEQKELTDFLEALTQKEQADEKRKAAADFLTGISDFSETGEPPPATGAPPMTPPTVEPADGAGIYTAPPQANGPPVAPIVPPIAPAENTNTYIEPDRADIPIVSRDTSVDTPNVVNHLIAAAQQINPNVSPNTIRASYKQRLAAANEQLASAEVGQEDGGLVDLAQAIAKAGGWNEMDRVAGNHYWKSRATGEIQALKDDAKGHGEREQFANAGKFGSMAGVPKVFRDDGLPTDVLLQALHQDPRFRRIQTADELRQYVTRELRRGPAPSSQGRLRLSNLRIDPQQQWWVPPHLRATSNIAMAQRAAASAGDDFNPEQIETPRPRGVPSIFNRGQGRGEWLEQRSDAEQFPDAQGAEAFPPAVFASLETHEWEMLAQLQHDEMRDPESLDDDDRTLLDELTGRVHEAIDENRPHVIDEPTPDEPDESAPDESDEGDEGDNKAPALDDDQQAQLDYLVDQQKRRVAELNKLADARDAAKGAKKKRLAAEYTAAQTVFHQHWDDIEKDFDGVDIDALKDEVDPPLDDHEPDVPHYVRPPARVPRADEQEGRRRRNFGNYNKLEDALSPEAQKKLDEQFAEPTNNRDLQIVRVVMQEYEALVTGNHAEEMEDGTPITQADVDEAAEAIRVATENYFLGKDDPKDPGLGAAEDRGRQIMTGEESADRDQLDEFSIFPTAHEAAALVWDTLDPKTASFDTTEFNTASGEVEFRKRADSLFPKPKKQDRVIMMADTKGGPPLKTIEEGRKQIEEWKKFAKEIGNSEDHSNEVVISLYDRTGTWSQPYKDAGYDVHTYDIENGQDLTDFATWMGQVEEMISEGKEIVAILGAPPCTSYAVSGNATWLTHHATKNRAMVKKSYGEWAAKMFDTPIDYANTLTAVFKLMVQQANPTIYAMENPASRIRAIHSLPEALLVFDPSTYGDDYEKQTQIWGEFDPHLPFNRVPGKKEDGGRGSLMHQMTGFTKEDQLERSIAPEGFAYAFFMANHGEALQKTRDPYGYDDNEATGSREHGDDADSGETYDDLPSHEQAFVDKLVAARQAGNKDPEWTIESQKEWGVAPNDLARLIRITDDEVYERGRQERIVEAGKKHAAEEAAEKTRREELLAAQDKKKPGTPPIKTKSAALEVGDEVSHAKHGIGKVVGLGKKTVVDFESGDRVAVPTKQLVKAEAEPPVAAKPALTFGKKPPSIATVENDKDQARLPGDVGAVRDAEVATPKVELPPQSLTLKGEDVPESMREKPPTMFDEDDVPESGELGSYGEEGAKRPKVEPRDKPKTYYDKEPTGPAAHPETGEPMYGFSVPELVELAKELLGLPKVVERFRKLGQLGVFRHAGSKAQIQIHADLFKQGRELELAQVIAHEIGHLVDWLPEKDLRRGNLLGRLYSLHKFLASTFTNANGDIIAKGDIKGELTRLSEMWRPYNKEAADKQFKAYRNSSVELMADAMSALLTNPDLLAETAPIFYREFYDAMERKPAFRNEYYALQDVMRQTPEARAERRVVRDRANLETYDKELVRLEEEKNKRMAARRFKNWWLRLLVQNVDKNAAVNKMTAGVIAKGVNVPQNANPSELAKERNVVNAEIQGFVDQNFKTMREHLDKAGVEWHTFAQFMQYDRTIKGDYLEKASAGGRTPESAAADRAALERQHTPAQNQAIETALSRFQHVVQSVAQQAYDAGLLTDEQIKEFKANKTYATFRNVEYLDREITSRVYHAKGSFGDVSNVANSTILKMMTILREAQNNRMKTATIEMLQTHHPDNIEIPERLGPHHFAGPKNNELKEVGHFVKGVWQKAYVDPLIADSIKNASVGANNAVVQIINKVNSGLFRPLFTGLNAGFQTFNAPRDFFRSWKNYVSQDGSGQTWSLGRAWQRYMQAVPLSKIAAFGLPADAKAKELQAWSDLTEARRAGVIAISFNAFNRAGRDVQDTEIDDIFARAGLVEDGPPAGWKATPVIKQVVGVFHLIEKVGNFLETLPKAAAMYEMKGDRAISELTPTEKSFIRENIGSPDFRAGGTWKPVTNEIWLFSNPIVQAWKADMSIAKKDILSYTKWGSPATRSGWVWKTAMFNIAPKLLMLAATAGLMGDWLKKIFERVSEYDKTNYLIVPLGMDAKGNAIYMRLPQDDTGRTIGGLAWKMFGGDKDLLHAAMQMFNYTQGQAPTVTPIVKAVKDTVSMAAGQNPYDDFRSRNLFTDQEMAAGGTRQLKKFFGWEFQQLGGSIWFGKLFFGDKRPQEKTTGQVILDMPLGVSDTLGRWIRISDQGLSESLRDAKAVVRGEKARHSMDELDAVNDAIREYMKIAPPLRQGGAGMGARMALARKIVEKVYPDMPRADQSKKTMEVQKKINAGTVRGSADPLVEEVMSAQSNAEKKVVIDVARKSMSKDEFVGWLDRAASNGVISREFSATMKRPSAQP